MTDEEKEKKRAKALHVSITTKTIHVLIQGTIHSFVCSCSLITAIFGQREQVLHNSDLDNIWIRQKNHDFFALFYRIWQTGNLFVDAYFGLNPKICLKTLACRSYTLVVVQQYAYIQANWWIGEFL